MPRRPTETPNRLPIPGEVYGYIESNPYGIATLRYKGLRRSLEMEFPCKPADKTKLLAYTKKVEKVFKVARKKLDTLRTPQRQSTVTPQEGRIGVVAAEEKFRRDKQIADMSATARSQFAAVFKYFFPNDFVLNDKNLDRVLSERLPIVRAAVSANYLNNITGRLDVFLRYCRYKKWITINPWDGGLDRPKTPDPTEKPPLTDEQIAAMIAWLLNHRMQSHREAAAAMTLQNAAGMRIGELVSLHWGELTELTVNVIDVDRIRLRYTKNGAREIPYSESSPIEWLREIAEAVDGARAWQGHGRRGARVFRWRDVDHLMEIYKKAFIAAGVPLGRLKSHLFRVTVKARQLRRGISKETVALIIGHTVEVSERDYRVRYTADDAIRELQKDLRT